MMTIEKDPKFYGIHQFQSQFDPHARHCRDTVFFFWVWASHRRICTCTVPEASLRWSPKLTRRYLKLRIERRTIRTSRGCGGAAVEPRAPLAWAKRSASYRREGSAPFFWLNYRKFKRTVWPLFPPKGECRNKFSIFSIDLLNARDVNCTTPMRLSTCTVSERPCLRLEFRRNYISCVCFFSFFANEHLKYFLTSVKTADYVSSEAFQDAGRHS